jgi:hypothetical protein
MPLSVSSSSLTKPNCSDAVFSLSRMSLENKASSVGLLVGSVVNSTIFMYLSMFSPDACSTERIVDSANSKIYLCQ